MSKKKRKKKKKGKFADDVDAYLKRPRKDRQLRAPVQGQHGEVRYPLDELIEQRSRTIQQEMRDVENELNQEPEDPDR